MQVNKMGGQALAEAASTAPILWLILDVLRIPKHRLHAICFDPVGEAKSKIIDAATCGLNV